MKTRMVSSATSFQRLQTSLQSPMPRLPRSNVYSTRDPANPSASVHRKRFFTPSLTPKFLCAGYLNPGDFSQARRANYACSKILTEALTWRLRLLDQLIDQRVDGSLAQVCLVEV